MRDSFGFVCPGGAAVRVLLVVPLVVPLVLFASMLGCQETPSRGQVEIEALSDVSAANVYVLLASGQGAMTRVDLVRQGEVWGGRADLGSTTSEYDVTAVATDGLGNGVSTARVGALVVSEAETALLHFALQKPQPNGDEQPPVVDALLASATEVSTNQAVDVRVFAHGSRSDDLLSYTWTPSCGRMLHPSLPDSVWVAPDSEATCDLDALVTDSRGGACHARLRINVQGARAVGSARVVVTINSSPKVTSMSASPAAVGDAPIVLSAGARDADGDSLSYLWSSTCAGTFDRPSANPTTFRAATVAPGQCNFSVEVSDGRGGKGSGVVVLSSARPAINVAPQMGITYQGSDQVSPGGSVLLHAEAIDPEGQPLRWTWTASAGTVSNQVDGIDGSGATFIAPEASGVVSTITVTATDVVGARSSFAFRVCTVGRAWEL
jgi:hypothetical protein